MTPPPMRRGRVTYGTRRLSGDAADRGPTVSRAEQKARAAELRAQRATLEGRRRLDNRADLRAGGQLRRCKVRLPSCAEHAALKEYPMCGALELESQLARHLYEVHGLTGTGDQFINACFEAAKADPEDSE